MIRHAFNFLILALGLGTLGAGLMLRARSVSPATIETAQNRVEELETELLALHEAEIVPPDRGIDRLPQRRTLGEVLATLHEIAERNHVESIAPVGAVEKASEAANAANPADPAARSIEPMSATLEGTAATPQPSAIECTVKIRATFAALTRFLGEVEDLRRTLRILSLEVAPEAELLSAQVTVAAYYYRGAQQ
ncbi:MAG: hypothetical protein AAF628_17460 [Planctomycetota bacterium]